MASSTQSAPLVSVIVPNFNHARFLRERLDSIVAQDLQDFELILLDDCSTDTSLATLEQYAADARVGPRVAHLVRGTRNSGAPCAQWKKGLELARGEFVWIAESDDVAEPALLSTLVGRLLRHPECVVASCRSMMIDEDSRELPDAFFATDELDAARWHNEFTNAGDDEVRRYLRFRNTIPNASAAVFRRAAASRVAMPEEMAFCGDWLFWVRLLQQGGLAHSPACLNRFRSHAQSTRSAHSRQHHRRRVCEYLRVLDECGAQLVPWPRPDGRDHSWMIRQMRARNPELAWHALRCEAVSPRLRAELFAASSWVVLQRAARAVRARWPAHGARSEQARPIKSERSER